MYNFGRLDFPNQHVSYAEKQEVDWYAKCCDYVIEAGIACKADFNVEEKFNILLGNIPREYYRKTLNPYNEKDENLTRFPATMRNYDMMKGIIRRYIGEYIKNPHDFICLILKPLSIKNICFIIIFCNFLTTSKFSFTFNINRFPIYT